jgi:Nucleotide modification associated domain 1
MLNTSQQFDASIAICRDIYVKKLRDYGTAWRVFRTSSLTDQLFIKARRVRTIQEKGTQKIADDVRGEFVALVNYSIMALIQLELANDARLELPENEANALYDKYAAQAKALMENKNHDYGEAWREMRISSLTDLILAKLLRIKQIEDNNGSTLISEGVDGNYFDIINYSIFVLIRFSEGTL